MFRSPFTRSGARRVREASVVHSAGGFFLWTQYFSQTAVAAAVLALAGTTASAAVLCNKHYCWRSNDYLPGARIQVRPDWRQSFLYPQGRYSILRPNYWNKDVFVTGLVGGGGG